MDSGSEACLNCKEFFKTKRKILKSKEPGVRYTPYVNNESRNIDTSVPRLGREQTVHMNIHVNDTPPLID